MVGSSARTLPVGAARADTSQGAARQRGRRYRGAESTIGSMLQPGIEGIGNSVFKGGTARTTSPALAFVRSESLAARQDYMFS